MFTKSAVTFVAAVALLSGCGLSAASQPPAGCPAEGWDAALVWSSGTDPAGQVAFVKEDKVVGHQSVPYQGLDPAPSDGAFRAGDTVWLKSNGDAGRGKTNILRYDTANCSMQAQAVGEQVVRAVAADQRGMVTTNTLNGAAQIIRRETGGKVLARASFPDLTLTALQPAGDHLYALGSTMGTETDVAVILDLDATTLAEKRRTTLTGVMGSGNLLLRGDRLYYPKTVVRGAGGAGGAEAEGSAMGVLNLSDFAQSEIPLGERAPDVVAADSQAIYTAHTFMNPSFRDTADYRTITRLDPETGTVQSLDAGPGLLGLAIRGDRLVVANQDAGGAATLTAYQLPGMTKVSSVSIPQPEGEHFYVASLLTPPA